MIHPIESYWLKWGSEETTYADRMEMEEKFNHLIEWLLYGNLDFDYISESLLEKTYHQNTDGFGVGRMKYEVVLVPDCLTLRANTVEALERFSEAGGHIIFIGKIPEYVAAVKNDRVKKLAEKCQRLPFEKREIREALEPWRTIEIQTDRGIPAGP